MIYGVKPPAFDRQGLSVDDLIDFTPELRAEAEKILSQFEHGELFHPPSERGTIQIPGWNGGGNWHGAGFDPDTGYLYVPSRTSPIVVTLVPGDPERTDFNYMRGGRRSVPGPQGLPLVKPPYARLTAVDLTIGEHAWQVTLGDGPRQRLVEIGLADPGPLGGGTYTGPVVTKTLLFLGLSGSRQSGQGPVLNAFDKATGEIVHAIDLPATLSGTPMTYMAGGTHYIVAAFGRGAESGLIALALP